MNNTIQIGQTWTDGEAVTGMYCGIAYRGRIVDDGSPYCSRRAPRGKTFIYVVKLDGPIMVFGEPRERIEIWQ